MLLQRSRMISWLKTHWKNWSGVWTSWKLCRLTDRWEKWPQTRYVDHLLLLYLNIAYRPYICSPRC